MFTRRIKHVKSVCTRCQLWFRAIQTASIITSSRFLKNGNRRLKLEKFSQNIIRTGSWTRKNKLYYCM